MSKPWFSSQPKACSHWSSHQSSRSRARSVSATSAGSLGYSAQLRPPTIQIVPLTIELGPRPLRPSNVSLEEPSFSLRYGADRIVAENCLADEARRVVNRDAGNFFPDHRAHPRASEERAEAGRCVLACRMAVRARSLWLETGRRAPLRLACPHVVACICAALIGANVRASDNRAQEKSWKPHTKSKGYVKQVGGDAGIRTLDRALQPYNGLANRRLQPLGHVSRAQSAPSDMPDTSARCKRSVPGRTRTRAVQPKGQNASKLIRRGRTASNRA